MGGCWKGADAGRGKILGGVCSACVLQERKVREGRAVALLGMWELVDVEPKREMRLEGRIISIGGLKKKQGCLTDLCTSPTGCSKPLCYH